MSRSRALVMAILALLLIPAARPALAQKRTLIDAIGAVDYLHGRASIHVGTWARYRTTGSAAAGVTDEYTSTVLIAGDEDWWGEECFWVETHTELPDGVVIPAATLMSYAIFDDSLAIPHLLVYQRKRITEVGEDGLPVQQVVRRGESQLKSRDPFGSGLTWIVDTLGVDTLRTAKGDFVCLKVRREQGVSQTSESQDSTRYTEIRKSRTTWITMDVPVTHYAREVFETDLKQRTWLTGRSKEAGPLRTVEHTTGTVELVDFGTAGVEALLVPEALRRPLSEQRAAKAQPVRKGTATATPRTGPAKR
jgi:hypothetical protein